MHYILPSCTNNHTTFCCIAQSKSATPGGSDVGARENIPGGGSAREVPSANNKAGAGAGETRPRFEETYQLGKELGHGSFSTVREGTHKVCLDGVLLVSSATPSMHRGLLPCLIPNLNKEDDA